MRAWAFLAALTGAATVCGAARAETVQPVGAPFSMEAPDGWSVETGVVGAERYVALASPDEVVAVNLRTVPVGPETPLADFRRAIERALLPGVEPVGVRSGAFLGTTGETAVYRLSRPGEEDVIFSALHAIIDQTGYSLVSILPLHDYNARKGEADAVFNSLRIRSLASREIVETRPAPPEPMTESVIDGLVLRHPAGWRAVPLGGGATQLEPDAPDAARVMIETLEGGDIVSAARNIQDQIRAADPSARFAPIAAAGLSLGAATAGTESFRADFTADGAPMTEEVRIIRRADAPLIHIVRLFGSPKAVAQSRMSAGVAAM